MTKEKIDRLLRSAAEAGEATQPSMPLGFDTRVVALWRAAAPKANGVLSLVRRVALVSAVVILVSTIAVVREASRRTIGRDLSASTVDAARSTVVP